MAKIKNNIELMASLLKPLGICFTTLEGNIQIIHHGVEHELSSSGRKKFI